MRWQVGVVCWQASSVFGVFFYTFFVMDILDEKIVKRLRFNILNGQEAFQCRVLSNKCTVIL